MSYIVKFPRRYEEILDELTTLRRKRLRLEQQGRKVSVASYVHEQDLEDELVDAALREKIPLTLKQP